jgi:hypothetical protein
MDLSHSQTKLNQGQIQVHQKGFLQLLMPSSRQFLD